MKKPKAMQAFDKIEVGEHLVYLNNNKAPEELQDVGFHTPLHSFLQSYSFCPFCHHNIVVLGNTDLSDYYYSDDGRIHYLWYCRNCRFWQWLYSNDEFADETKEWTGEGCPPNPEQFAYISKLREFEEDLPIACSAELAQYLRSNPDNLNYYDPKRFEKLVADIFKANYENADVSHVGKPDDGGIDIKLIESNSHQWLIQVKRREKLNCAEGVSTIRDLLGTLVLEGQTRGIVVSTADHFTLRARQAAQAAKKLGFNIELVDKGILNQMLEPFLPDRPWIEIVKSHDSEIASWLMERISNDNQLFEF